MISPSSSPSRARGGSRVGTGAGQAAPGCVVRWVDRRGLISLAGFTYRAEPAFVGEPVEVVCAGRLVQILYRRTLIATHAQRRRPDDRDAKASTRAPALCRARPAATGVSVSRISDHNGAVSFAGTSYREWRPGRSRPTPRCRRPGGSGPRCPYATAPPPPDEPCPRELSDAQLAVRIAAVDAASKGTYARRMTHAVLRLCARTRMIQMWHQAKPLASGSSGNVCGSD